MMIILLLGFVALAIAGSPVTDKETYKNQYCTDPRTMKKHPAYTEWADTYSCTRHRCQPGGRNLAIYTVGCKRIEAPESAIECEEVVEDTNMQFPFCCTRLRCLVLVRGEVWTKVLGQPWETLPAAPWSHMYKMKKPPPVDSTALPKTPEAGPIYELAENEAETAGHDKMPRSGKKPASDNETNSAPVLRANAQEPETATVTSEGKEGHKRHNKRRNSNTRTQEYACSSAAYDEVTESEKRTESVNEVEETPASTTEKPLEMIEEETENYFPSNAEIPKAQHKSHKSHNTEFRSDIPQNQWNEPTEGSDLSEHLEIPGPNVEELELVPKKEATEKPSNLQVLVDAIGTRMRDIESVVQKMSDKVHHKPDADCSNEKSTSGEREGANTHKEAQTKRPSTEDENYKRFLLRSKLDSKYLHSSTDTSTEPPLIIGDSNLLGYFSDASNSILRRKSPLKELKPTYMAPVENHRKAHVLIADPDNSETPEKKHKRHGHKKRKSKTHTHKKRSRSKEDKRKHFKKIGSAETEKNAISVDDSSGGAQ